MKWSRPEAVDHPIGSATDDKFDRLTRMQFVEGDKSAVSGHRVRLKA
jgi:hypothetical protein